MGTVFAQVILIVVLIAATVFYVYLFWDSVANSRHNRIVYVCSSLSTCLPILEDCISHYIPDTSKVWMIEAGAGHAYVSRFLATRYQWKEVVAVEVSRFRLFLARLGNLSQRAPVRFVHANVFDYAYQPGALIYCYLSPEILQGLYESKKFSGCLVLSLSFAIPDVPVTEKITLPNWQKQLLVYDFREA